MYLLTCGSFKSATKFGSAKGKVTNYVYENHKIDWVRNLQIRKVPHLWKVRKSIKLLKSANLRICDLRNLFADLWFI